VESKWKNYHITTFLGQSLSKTGLSLEEAMDLSRDRLKKKEVIIFYPEEGQITCDTYGNDGRP
jgi:hypothetical protein